MGCQSLCILTNQSTTFGGPYGIHQPNFVWRNYIENFVKAINIYNNKQLKKLMTKGIRAWISYFLPLHSGQVVRKNSMFLPIQKHGTNWGIWHAKIKLTWLNLKAPWWNINVGALELLSRAQLEKHHLFNKSNTMSWVLMVFWHIHCEYLISKQKKMIIIL